MELVSGFLTGFNASFGVYPHGWSGDPNGLGGLWTRFGTRKLLSIGNGTSSAPKDSFAVDEAGYMWFVDHETPAGYLYSSGTVTKTGAWIVTDFVVPAETAV